MSASTPIPASLPGYRLLEQIGAGGSGTVYRAEGTDELRRAFAVKVFPPAQRDAYTRELETLRAIEAVRAAAGSQDLVETVAADEADGHGYVVMEYVQGGSLEDRVRVNGPLDAPRAVAFMKPVLRALQLLHDHGLLHKDVKPGNVLVGDDGRARLGDFGLARPIDGPLSSAGTPGFCAPELYAGRGLDSGDARVDVYSASATLYYLLTGEAPLPGRPDLFLLERHHVSRGVQDLLFAGLAEDPARRTASAAALSAALDETTRAPARRARLPKLAAGVLGAVALGIAAVLVSPGAPATPLLWNGRELSLAGPRVEWSPTGRATIPGLGSVDALGAPPSATARGPKGRVLAAVGAWGSAAAVDLTGARPKLVLRLPGEVGLPGDEPLSAVATDGRFFARMLVGGTGDDRIDVHDLSSGERIRFETQPTGACALTLHSEPKAERPVVILGLGTGTLVVLFPDGREHRLSAFADEVLALSVDPRSRRVFAVGDERPLQPASELSEGAALIGDGSLGVRSGPDLRLKVFALDALLNGSLELIGERDANASLPRSVASGR